VANSPCAGLIGNLKTSSTGQLLISPRPASRGACKGLLPGVDVPALETHRRQIGQSDRCELGRVRPA
jgi:hypothetical protein